LASQSVASLERRNQVYRRLQLVTHLGKDHQAQLLARGYNEQEIQLRGYRSLPPEDRWKLAKECHNGTASTLRGVPGFFTNKAKNGYVYWSIGGSPGLLIPCRDPAGLIRAYRIRPDDPGKGGKYRWLSSANKSSGTGSGVHCHVARPLAGMVQDKVVWITEGEIKADLAAQRLGAVVVSIPGVSSWSRAVPDVAAILPSGGRVVVALDTDWKDKPPVQEAIWSLWQTCLALGYETEVATWDVNHKGLDDALKGGLTPQPMAPEEFPEPAWSLKISSRVLVEMPGMKRPAAVTLAKMRDPLPQAFVRRVFR
jgi:hypothetical protein